MRQARRVSCPLPEEPDHQLGAPGESGAAHNTLIGTIEVTIGNELLDRWTSAFDLNEEITAYHQGVS